tara:strand:+ start:272 stop:481 length:210 start_codon:yes stop_codon:yes gene_type:complete
MAFLLVVLVSGEVVSDDRMLFKNIYRCNEFALAIEEGRMGPKNKRYRRNQGVTAYCIPRMINENTPLIE